MVEAQSRQALAPVVLVTGKGGVGKTTVAAGLAHDAWTREGRAVLVEFGDGDAGKRVLGRGSKVEHVVIKPAEAIEEMAADLFGSAILSKVVIGNFAMRRLLRAAPALRELAQLESVRRISVERPGVRVVVDMPATGHGVAWLRVPAQMRDLLRGGPLQELSKRLSEELIAEGRCSVVIVSLPERLVLEETLELAEAIREDVGLPAGRLIINRVPAAMPPHALKEARRLASGESKIAWAATELVEIIAARDQARSEALGALEEVMAGTGMKPVSMPLSPVDPQASEVAGWLSSEGAT